MWSFLAFPPGFSQNRMALSQREWVAMQPIQTNYNDDLLYETIIFLRFNCPTYVVV